MKTEKKVGENGVKTSKFEESSRVNKSRTQTTTRHTRSRGPADDREGPLRLMFCLIVIQPKSFDYYVTYCYFDYLIKYDFEISF